MVQRTHSLALENARRREELQVGEIERMRGQLLEVKNKLSKQVLRSRGPIRII